MQPATVQFHNFTHVLRHYVCMIRVYNHQGDGCNRSVSPSCLVYTRYLVQCSRLRVMCRQVSAISEPRSELKKLKTTAYESSKQPMEPMTYVSPFFLWNKFAWKTVASAGPISARFGVGAGFCFGDRREMPAYKFETTNSIYCRRCFPLGTRLLAFVWPNPTIIGG